MHDNDFVISYVYIHAAPLSSQPEPAETPYLFLANYPYIHQISLDGNRLRTVISKPGLNIFTLDYHSRYYH